MRWFMIMMIYECTYSATMLINKQDDECNVGGGYELCR